jgi:hypothetical protein
MTDPAGLERGYRRLLAWYPQPYRREHEEEVLAVLMASARKGQRRPGPAESADVLRSALGMRFRLAWSGSPDRGWADALAVFSVVAPLFLLAVDLFEVALPYQLPTGQLPSGAQRIIQGPPLSGLSLLQSPGFDFAAGGQMIIAALVLLGRRRMALAATVVFAFYWIAGKNAFPVPLVDLLATSVCLLEAAALIASPGPRRGRHLMNWGHVVVLLLAAAAVKVSLVGSALMNLPGWMLPGGMRPDLEIYLVITVVLVATAGALTVALRLGRYFLLLLLAAMIYPYAIQIAAGGVAINPLSYLFSIRVSGGYLALLYLPPLLFGAAAVTAAALTAAATPPAPLGG